MRRSLPTPRIRASRYRRSAWGSLVFLGLTGCSLGTASTGPQGPLAPGGKHVLFIGNSLTYSNDLPSAVIMLADLAGDTVRAKSVAYPNFALIDHATGVGGSRTIDVIKGEPWDMVVVQQGPTFQSLCADTLALAVQILDGHAKASGAKTGVFEVWPSRTDLQFFDAHRLSYQRAASQVNAVFMPAGEAWQLAWQVEPDLALYSSDNFHPSALGTWLAALVIFEKVTNRDARLLPAQPIAARLGISIGIVDVMKNAASAANGRYPLPASSTRFEKTAARAITC
jgi:hypothetical protein